MTFTWFFSTESYVTRHAGSRHCSPLVNPQKLNIMSIKFWFVIASGMTVLSQESMAQATCPGTVGASSTPDSDFMVNANGTVVHNTTELMWKRCNEGLTGLACATGTATFITWFAALTTAKTSSFAGYGDWRVPNKQELESLVDATCGFPAINETIFPGTKPAETWISTTVRLFRDNAHFVYFRGGGSSRLSKADAEVCARRER